MYPHLMKSLHVGIALTAMPHQQVLMKASTTELSELVGRRRSRKRKRREAKIKFLATRKPSQVSIPIRKALLNHLSMPKKILIGSKYH